jgi:hypothetical protein
VAITSVGYLIYIGGGIFGQDALQSALLLVVLLAGSTFFLILLTLCSLPSCAGTDDFTVLVLMLVII